MQAALLINRKGLGMDESENVRNAEGTTMTPVELLMV